MKANDTRIRIFLEGSKQFMVPLFQRTYSWKKEHVQQLWEDIVNTKNNGGTTHFFGSFVTMPLPSSPSLVSKFLIIDGQQRLVTIFVFLAALRNRIMEIRPNYEKKDEINELYLINKYHPEDKYKVMPTQTDREVFLEILDKFDPPKDAEYLITETYEFFADKLSELDDLEELIAVKDTILSDFSVVDIRLEGGDDPYLIFESLNAKGTPLTQADLIRNYLFMRIGQNKQQQVYDEIWLPMQEMLTDYLEQFIRHYLAMDGDIPNFKRIYSTFKEITDRDALDEGGVIQRMRELLKFSEYYSKFLYPQNEEEQELRNYFERFNKLNITTSYPLLLRLYDNYVDGKLTSGELSKCLKVVETYIVRRAVCGIPTQALNRFFPTVYKSLDKSNVVVSLIDRLKSGTGTRRVPSDDEFEECLRENSLYDNKILRYILEEIEKYDNKEVVDFENLQIEHIMPQKLSVEWKETLGSKWELTHEKYLDTLGNLTLTGYNPEYSNKSFSQKRDMRKGFKNSGLRINRDLAKLNRWTEREIKKRAQRLSKIALKIWPI